ncbi:PREDICTED: aminopeptidase N-like [Priapulus caudatus]|uniref:Aminopeptidase n=1 Tax=Priapulus caudatus TaxID=37621 RepID=A0ABM1DT04_PRICU|nr:PREDICTED: aminopeptidase N-like [Priapulus caudatus]
MFVTRTVAVVVVAVVSVAIVVTGLIVGLTTRSCEELQETTTLVPSTQPPTATASKPSSSATIVTTMDKTTPEPTTPVPTARPELLLPGNIVPTYYSLYLWPDLTDFKTSGWVDITVTCTNPTSSFIVHSTRSKCEVIQSKTSIRSVGSENALKITAQKYIEEKEFFEITLDKALNKDGEYVVHLEFEGNVEEDLAGLYLSSYTDADQTVKYLVTTQMQPTNARRAFPCFDEPKYKAVFNVTLVRAQHMLSLSNMDIVSESEPIAPDVQELVYCTAIANGNEEEWNFAWEQFNSSNVASEETKLLRSMACTNEMWILEMFLKRTLLMDGIKRTQGDSVISYVANNVVGNVLAWNFLRENWSTLYGRYKHSFSAMDRMVKSCTDRFNTQWEQDQVRAWARPELIHQAEYALNTTAAIMEAFEDYFNLSYPLKKTELIAIPDFSAGAMENWGLVTYREERMLYEEGVSTSADKKSIARVIGHELTHMWFGNLVTCEWWDHLWLNEGFASYFQYVGADFVEPEWMLLDQFVVDNNPLAFASDALATSHPVVADVLTNSEIQGIFDRISYQKGGALSQMMQAMLHEDVWLAGLMEHLKRLPYKTANTDQLWESIQSAVDAKGVSSRLDGMTVKEVMDTWTLQSGYPLLNVSIDYASGDVTVSQSHFLLDPTGIQPPDSDYGYKWEVPFFYTTASEGTFETPNVEWLHPDRDVEMTISENNWLIGNAGVKGFYRVMYDDKNWENIINQLKDSHTKINTRNRAQLFEDAFTLAKALLMNQTHALELTEYLNDESDYLPWHTALTQLSYLDLMLSRSSSYGLFKAYMVLQIDKLYNEIGWQIYSDEEQMKTFSTGGAVYRGM